MHHTYQNTCYLNAHIKIVKTETKASKLSASFCKVLFSPGNKRGLQKSVKIRKIQSMLYIYLMPTFPKFYIYLMQIH